MPRRTRGPRRSTPDRAFEQDAKDNTASRGQRVATQVLYMRGDREVGDIDTYVRELRNAGLDVRGEQVRGSGHFLPDEQPDALAAALRRFVELLSA